MSLIDAVLATLAAENDHKIDGRTLFQKKLYFLGVLCGEDFGHEAYFYGPYSSEVSSSLETLVGAGFIEERVTTLPEWSSNDFEPRQFHYELTSVGNEVVWELRGDLAPYEHALVRVNGHPVAKSAKLLSVAAKVHFISSREAGLSTAAIKAKAEGFNWKLSSGEVAQATEYLRYLNLLK